jgi:hypothetical protein
MTSTSNEENETIQLPINESKNLTINASSESKFNYRNDFIPCSGIDLSEKEMVAYHRILLAKSDDGYISQD